MPMRSGFALAAAIVARIEAIVPPEKVPLMARMRPFTAAIGLPVFLMACCWRINTPRSKGIESNPQL